MTPLRTTLLKTCYSMIAMNTVKYQLCNLKGCAYTNTCAEVHRWCHVALFRTDRATSGLTAGQNLVHLVREVKTQRSLVANSPDRYRLSAAAASQALLVFMQMLSHAQGGHAFS